MEFLRRHGFAVAVAVFAAAAVTLLWQEHRAHILGVAPYLLLLACPLMHFFMHRGHGHGDGHGKPPHDHGARP